MKHQKEVHMQNGLTLLEIIGLAIKSEEDAVNFYIQLSELIKNELVQNKYESLAKEEIGHRHMLIELYKKMTGEDSAPPKIPGEPLTAEGGMPPMAIDSLEELLKFAIKCEHSANDFYRRAATQTSDNNAKRILGYLAGIEMGHEILIKSELEAYLQDKNWYAEKPDVQLVGP